MKNLILWMLLLGFISSGHSQILLKEAKVDYKAETMKLDPNSNQLVIKIPEKVVGEFQKDPLSFVRDKFDIQKFVRDNEEKDYGRYIVHFKSLNGSLIANFKDDGSLVSSHQKFKNVKLPEDARLQILAKYRDARVVKNNYSAFSRGWDLKKEFYRVKIKDGDRTRRLKINKDKGYLSLAGH